MKRYLKLYLSSAIIFLIVDLIWLIGVNQHFYAQQLGSLMGAVRLLPAVLFYMLFIVGLLYFVILPAVVANRVEQAVYSGALFGLICYATYDLTNLATLAHWPVLITVTDLIWGSFITSLTAGSVSWLALKRNW